MQSGADQAGVASAKAAGLSVGGTMPLGFLTEFGPRPGFALLYNAEEHGSSAYPPRTQKNVDDSDATIWFGDGDSMGFGCTRNACRRAGKALYVVKTGVTTPRDVAKWIIDSQIEILNIAGNRETKSPCIGSRVERFLTSVFALVMETMDA